MYFLPKLNVTIVAIALVFMQFSPLVRSRSLNDKKLLCRVSERVFPIAVFHSVQLNQIH